MTGNLEDNMLFGYAMLFLGFAIYVFLYIAVPCVVANYSRLTKKNKHNCFD